MVEIDACSVERVSDGEEKVSDDGERVSDGEEKVSDDGERLSDDGERLSDDGEKLSDGDERVNGGDERENDDDEKASDGDERERDGDEEKETIGGGEQHRVECRSGCGCSPLDERRDHGLGRRRLWQRTRVVLVGESTLGLFVRNKHAVSLGLSLPNLLFSLPPRRPPQRPRARSPRLWLQTHPPGRHPPHPVRCLFSSLRHRPHITRKHVAVAAAQILFQRFWYASSMKHFGVAVGPCFLSPPWLVHFSPGHQHGCPLPRVQASRIPLAHA